MVMKVVRLAIPIAMAVGLALPSPIRADYVWDSGGADRNWSTPENWNPDGEPGPVYTAEISNGDTANITQAGEECSDLILGSMAGEIGNVVIVSDPGSLTARYTEVVGRYGTGTFVQNAGSNEATGILYLGRYPGSWGRYELNGALSQLSTSVEYVGTRGTGVFDHNNGTSTADELYVGRDSSATGVYNLNGGTKIVGYDFYVGYNGTGTLNIDFSGGPTLKIGGTLKVGMGSGVGNMTLTGDPTQAHIEIGDYEYGGSATWDVALVTSIHDVTFKGSWWKNKSLDDLNTDWGKMHVRVDAAGPFQFEVASTPAGGFTNNFALAKITVVAGSALSFVNQYDNGNGGLGGGLSGESVFTEALDILDGASLDVYAYYLYVDGNVKAQLDTWIGDGRLFSSLGPIEAVYDAGNTWTYVTPEPATLSLLAAACLPLLRRHRRSCLSDVVA